MGTRVMWGISVPSAQFCGDLKTALKNKVYEDIFKTGKCEAERGWIAAWAWLRSFRHMPAPTRHAWEGAGMWSRGRGSEQQTAACENVDVQAGPAVPCACQGPFAASPRLSDKVTSSHWQAHSSLQTSRRSHLKLGVHWQEGPRQQRLCPFPAGQIPSGALAGRCPRASERGTGEEEPSRVGAPSVDNEREGTARRGRHPAAHSLPAQPRSPKLSCLRGGLSLSFTESCRGGPKVVCESHNPPTGCLVPWSVCLPCL